MFFADAVALEITPGSVLAGSTVIGVAIVTGFVIAAWMIRSTLNQNSAQTNETIAKASESIEKNSELARQTNTLIRVLAAQQGTRLHPEE